MEAQCLMCGAQGMLMTDDNNHWVYWRAIYKRQLRRFLCLECCKKYPPVTIVAMEKGDKQALRLLPLENEYGLLSSVFKTQLQSHPFFFPLRHLCEKGVNGQILKAFSCADCCALSVKCTSESDYWTHTWSLEKGYIYTIVPRSLTVPRTPINVTFSGHYTDNDWYKCAIREHV